MGAKRRKKPKEPKLTINDKIDMWRVFFLLVTIVLLIISTIFTAINYNEYKEIMDDPEGYINQEVMQLTAILSIYICQSHNLGYPMTLESEETDLILECSKGIMVIDFSDYYEEYPDSEIIMPCDKEVDGVCYTDVENNLANLLEERHA